MKIIDILNKIANGELKDGFEFKYNDLHFIYFKNVNEVQRLENGINIGRIYYLDKHLNDEVEVIEENKEIEELHEYKNIGYSECDIKTNREKLNEVIRAVNKINKQLEELETSSEISEEEINDAIKRAREYIEREEK